MKKPTKKLDKLVAQLKEIAEDSNGDPEIAHREADDALLKYIGNDGVWNAFNKINKWYA